MAQNEKRIEDKSQQIDTSNSELNKIDFEVLTNCVQIIAQRAYETKMTREYRAYNPN